MPIRSPWGELIINFYFVSYVPHGHAEGHVIEQELLGSGPVFDWSGSSHNVREV